MAAKNRIELNIGDPKSDGQYLISGFSVPSAAGARLRRGVNQEARMILPAFRGVENTVTMEIMCPKPPNALKVSGSAGVLGSIQFKEAEWTTFAFSVPADAIDSNGSVALSLHFERFDPSAHWTPSCAHLSGITVEAEGGQASPQLPAPSAPSYGLYFGDPHGHSDFSFCDKPYSGSPTENYEYARDVAKLDFFALADHSEHMADEVWAEATEISDSFNAEGSFVTLPCYEWTSELFGHRNVYHRETAGKQFGSVHPATNTPKKLWKALREQGNPAITIPHHPSRIEFTGTWSSYDPEFVPAVEIYSKWGASEYYGNIRQEKHKTVIGCFAQDALARGHRVGFIGGSDGHVLMPGTRGITAVYAESLDRAQIFDGIKHRRCYATTGAWIGLDFRLNQRLMGRDLVVTPYQAEALYPLVLYVSVAPTAPVEKIEIIESNHVIYTYTFTTGGGHPGYHSEQLEALSEKNGLERISFWYLIDHPRKTWVPFATHQAGRPLRQQTWDRYFYVRVSQTDGHMAWSSPVWITVVPREDEA